MLMQAAHRWLDHTQVGRELFKKMSEEKARPKLAGAALRKGKESGKRIIGRTRTRGRSMKENGEESERGEGRASVQKKKRKRTEEKAKRGKRKKRKENEARRKKKKKERKKRKRRRGPRQKREKETRRELFNYKTQERGGGFFVMRARSRGGLGGKFHRHG
ncbi:hypothetical protein, partial [Burkholderia pseudomallei]|uniref:hypothetical protein n=1 Tax=Burkholderia pseudomallei TaxID=28450 RepID=UPI0021F7794C